MANVFTASTHRWKLLRNDADTCGTIHCCVPATHKVSVCLQCFDMETDAVYLRCNVVVRSLAISIEVTFMTAVNAKVVMYVVV